MTYPITRRKFIKTGSSALAAASLIGLSSCGGSKLDLLLTGGTVLDGSGSEGAPADIGILGGRIVEIGELSNQSATRIIDVSGLVVAPGFIDFHSHSDDELLTGSEAQSKIRQGVTTEVLGQDGDSMAPLSAEMREKLNESLRDRYDLRCNWTDFEGYFWALKKAGMVNNAITMVGQGTIRAAVIGQENKEATPEDIARMKQLAEVAFQQGAYGISSGLEYVPGSFATQAEIAELCKSMNGRGIYSTHMRNEDDTVVEAVEEAISIGREAGVPVNITHMKASGRRNWHKVPDILLRMDDARASGMSVTCDRYPYIAFNTGLSSLYPIWSRDGGREKFYERLRNPALRDSLQTFVEEKVRKLGGWNSIMISSLPLNPSRAEYEGERLGDLSPAYEPTYDMLHSLLLREEGGGDMVGFAMSEENTSSILGYEYCMPASDASARNSDGLLSQGNPHPRTFGTFPRVLGFYVRRKKIMSLAEAVRKCTFLPASLLGLADRGLLKAGNVADIVAFDSQKVIDRATWSNPHRYPVGIPYVIVNGVVTVDGGDYSGALAGDVIRG